MSADAHASCCLPPALLVLALHSSALLLFGLLNDLANTRLGQQS